MHLKKNSFYYLIRLFSILFSHTAQSAGAVEYTDCIFVEW